MVHGGREDCGATEGLWECFPPISLRSSPPTLDQRRGQPALSQQRTHRAQARLKSRGLSESLSRPIPKHRTTPLRNSPRCTGRTQIRGLGGTLESRFTAQWRSRPEETGHRPRKPSFRERTLSMKLPRLECEHTRRQPQPVTYRGVTRSTMARNSSTCREEGLLCHEEEHPFQGREHQYPLEKEHPSPTMVTATATDRDRTLTTQKGARLPYHHPITSTQEARHRLPQLAISLTVLPHEKRWILLHPRPHLRTDM